MSVFTGELARPRRNGLMVAAIAAPLVAGCGTPATPSAAQADAGALALLAPGARLRVGLYEGSPSSIVTDAVTGERRGVGFEVGAEIAKRLGVAYEPVVFPRNAEVLPALLAGKLDLVFTNASPARAQDIAFTPAVLRVEQGYLVPAGSSIASMNEVDHAGVRVGVSQGSTSQAALTSEFKNAEVVVTLTLPVAAEMLASGRLSAFASNKSILFQMSGGLRGATVLAGHWGLEHLSFGIPKAKSEAMPLLAKVVAEVTRDGTVARAVERAGMRGALPAAD